MSFSASESLRHAVAQVLLVADALEQLSSSNAPGAPAYYRPSLKLEGSVLVSYSHISCMPAYQRSSPEELRVEYYVRKKAEHLTASSTGDGSVVAPVETIGLGGHPTRDALPWERPIQLVIPSRPYDPLSSSTAGASTSFSFKGLPPGTNPYPLGFGKFSKWYSPTPLGFGTGPTNGGLPNFAQLPRNPSPSASSTSQASVSSSSSIFTSAVLSKEREWEAARAALTKAKLEYDVAALLEKEKFKAYCEARLDAGPRGPEAGSNVG